MSDTPTAVTGVAPVEAASTAPVSVSEDASSSFEAALAAATGRASAAADKTTGEAAQEATAGQAAQAPEAGRTAEPAQPAAAVVADPRLEALLAREAAVDAKLAEAKALLERLQPKPEPTTPVAKRKAPVNWAKAIQSIDPDADPGQVAEHLWYEKTGRDKAPADYKAHVAITETHEQLAAMREELEAKIAQISQVQEQANIDRYRAQVVAELPQLAPKYPLVSRLAPAKAAEQLMQAANFIAVSEQRVPTPDEAAKALEAHLGKLAEEYAGVFGSASAPPATPAPPEAKKPPQAAGTLWNADAGSNPPPKAGIDSNDDDALRRAALIAAGYSPAAAANVADRLWAKR